MEEMCCWSLFCQKESTRTKKNIIRIITLIKELRLLLAAVDDDDGREGKERNVMCALYTNMVCTSDSDDGRTGKWTRKAIQVSRKNKIK